jgi:hypothetical protein
MTPEQTHQAFLQAADYLRTVRTQHEEALDKLQREAEPIQHEMNGCTDDARFLVLRGVLRSVEQRLFVLNNHVFALSWALDKPRELAAYLHTLVPQAFTKE